MKITEQPFSVLKSTQEGIVLLGAGGNPQEWIDGVFKTWKKEKLTTGPTPEAVFSKAFLLKTSGGRTDLALTFKRKAPIDLGRLALWRLQFGDCSWVSDYKVNYAAQHNA